MSRPRIQALVAVILATILVGAGLTATLAYVEQRQFKVELSAPYSVKCSDKALVTARVTRVKNGSPVANQAVSWSIVVRQSRSDRLSRSTSLTNRQGVASTKLVFGPKAGKRVVKATIPGVKTQITLRCKGGLG
jgi:hypothetical protein